MFWGGGKLTYRIFLWRLTPFFWFKVGSFCQNGIFLWFFCNILLEVKFFVLYTNIFIDSSSQLSLFLAKKTIFLCDKIGVLFHLHEHIDSIKLFKLGVSNTGKACAFLVMSLLIGHIINFQKMCCDFISFFARISLPLFYVGTPKNNNVSNGQVFNTCMSFAQQKNDTLNSHSKRMIL